MLTGFVATFASRGANWTAVGYLKKTTKSLRQASSISSASDAVFLIRVASKTLSSIQYPTSPTYAKCNLVMFQSAPVESEPRITSR